MDLPIIPGYSITSLSGKGGFKVVYLATYTETDTKCAIAVQHIKNINEHASNFLSSRGRNAKTHCSDEAKKLCNLSNEPHIPKILDFPRYDENQDLYWWSVEPMFQSIQQRLDIAEKCIHTDMSLEERISTLHKSEINILDIARGVAHALAAAQRQNFVNGDIKPDNIGYFKTSDGKEVVKVFDWNLCSFDPPTDNGQDWPVYRRTRAPEIFDGGSPTFFSDMWSFGILIDRLLLGRYRFDYDYSGDRTAFYKKNTSDQRKSYEPGIKFKIDAYCANPSIIASEIRQINRISKKKYGVFLGDIIQKCIAPKPEDRYSSFDELHLALQPRVTYRKLFAGAAFAILAAAAIVSAPILKRTASDYVAAYAVSSELIDIMRVQDNPEYRRRLEDTARKLRDTQKGSIEFEKEMAPSLGKSTSEGGLSFITKSEQRDFSEVDEAILHPYLDRLGKPLSPHLRSSFFDCKKRTVIHAPDCGYVFVEDIVYHGERAFLLTYNYENNLHSSIPSRILPDISAGDETFILHRPFENDPTIHLFVKSSINDTGLVYVVDIALGIPNDDGLSFSLRNNPEIILRDMEKYFSLTSASLENSAAYEHLRWMTFYHPYNFNSFRLDRLGVSRQLRDFNPLIEYLKYSFEEFKLCIGEKSVSVPNIAFTVDIRDRDGWKQDEDIRYSVKTFHFFGLLK